jgi:hypothetical protein
MEENLGPYMAVLVAFAVFLWPLFFYLWLRWYVQKRYGPFGDDATHSAAYDQRPDLQQARRSLRRVIRWRTGT